MSSGVPGRVLVLVTLVVALTACGADDGLDGSGGSSTTAVVEDGRPRVANVRFDGDFIIGDVTLADGPVDLEAIAAVNIETEFGALTLEPACNTYFGSFSLGEDGSASFSIAGGTGTPCDGLERQEQAVISAMSQVSRWSETADGFRFDGPDGQAFTLTRL